MSVVNDMLRDLDKRKAPERGDFSEGTVSRESMIEQRKPIANNKTIIALAVCIVISLVAYGVLGKLESAGVDELPIAENLDLAKENGVIKDFVKDVVDVVETTQEEQASKALSVSNSQNQQIDNSLVSTGKEKEIEKGSSSLDRKSAKRSQKGSASKLESTISRNSSEHGNNHTTTKPVVINSQKTKLKPEMASKAVVAKPKTIESMPPVRNVVPAPKDKSQLNTEKVAALGPGVEKENFKLKLSPKAQDEQAAETAKKLFKQGRGKEAYQLLESFVGSHQIKNVSEALLAQAYLQDRKIDQFLALLETASQPLSPGLQQSKARWLMANNKVQEAVEMLRNQLPSIDDYPDHYALLASAYQKLGEHGKALETYSELIQFNDQIADWWAGLGLSADQLGQARQAKVAYQQALNMKGLNTTLADYVRQRLRSPEMNR